MHDLQERILKLIVQSQGNLLDNEDLIDTLEASKKTTTVISERMLKAEETQANIRDSRNQYLPIVEQCSVIYFVICGLKNIDAMYDFSLESFIQFFNKKIIENQAQKESTVLRVRLLKKFLSEMIFQNICRGLFERHKLLFAFMISIKLLLKQKSISKNQWNFFKICETDMVNQNQCPAFVDKKIWNKLAQTEHFCPNLMDISEQVIKHEKEFKDIMDSEQLDLKSLAFLPQSEVMTQFEKLLLLKLLRPDWSE